MLRSLVDAWTSRGYQASGTEIERPSLKSTVKVSSVAVTLVAAGTVISIAEELIPCLHQRVTVFEDKLFDPPNLAAAEAAALR